jgi:hypothetical protein
MANRIGCYDVADVIRPRAPLSDGFPVEWTWIARVLEQVPKQDQRQDSFTDQAITLREVLNRLGYPDAATFITKLETHR